MSENDQMITISRVEAVSFQSRDDGPSGYRKGFRNALVKIEAKNNEDQKIAGSGEAQFRGRETGDHGRHSWNFLIDSLESLKDRKIDVSSKASACRSIANIMTVFADEAGRRDAQLRENEVKTSRFRLKSEIAKRIGIIESVKPYRGVLFGIETALLDLAANALHVSVSELLSELSTDNATREPNVINAVPAAYLSPEEIIEVAKERRDKDGAQQALWLDLGRRFGLKSILERVDLLAAEADRGTISSNIVLQNPLQFKQYHRLPKLERYIRKLTRSKANSVSIKTVVDLKANEKQVLSSPRQYRGSKIIAVRPNAMGGLLPSLKILQDFHERYGLPSYFVGDQAGGKLANAALEQLGQATQAIKGIVIRKQHPEESAGVDYGLGIVPAWDEVVNTIKDRFVFPEEELNEGEKKLNLYPEEQHLQILGPNGTKGHLLEREALSLGMSTIRFDKGAFLAKDGVNEPMLMKWSRTPVSSAVSLSICTHKEATRIRLDRAGVPVPRGRTFRNGDLDTAREFADQLGYPVVVKPAMGVRGIGVVAGIQNRKELDIAFEQLQDSQLGAQDFILEKHIPGQDYRILVIGDKVEAAILREPASVVGDGEHTIAELLVRKNALRRHNPHLAGRLIQYDAAAKYQLDREGLTLDSVPEDGKRVLLSNSSSLSQGGDSTDVLDELHPTIKEACVQAVKAIPGLGFCGVDFLIEDHTKPVTEQEAGICELNAHAAIGNCEYPSYGTPRQVTRALMDACVQKYDLRVPAERAKKLSLHLVVRGRVTGVGYREWIRSQAQRYNVAGWIRNDGKNVEIVLSGDTPAVTSLVAAAALGPARAKPTSVTTEHIHPPATTEFSIVNRPVEELGHVN